jgi:hypothetical protein
VPLTPVNSILGNVELLHGLYTGDQYGSAVALEGAGSMCDYRALGKGRDAARSCSNTQ